ncbi:hypothetical protein NQF87_00590 [Bombella sp. TMW 2.2559]|uniref:Uncharacterized protein n=1 Tax=Bombella dulcis TaxID=2967339 RepID=A0ABT3WCI2_9PROT|nr:hypothetical protein [Bombella dulcis]MCX5615482.1 hypothetical protein [Bombella dulcis]
MGGFLFQFSGSVQGDGPAWGGIKEAWQKRDAGQAIKNPAGAG